MIKKALFTLTILLGLSFAAQAQGDGNTGNHFTIGQLSEMGKLDLTSIYVTQVHKLNTLLPYVPFNQKGDAVSLSNMGIPNSKDNNGHIKKLDTSGGTHNEVLDETLNNIVPYADKEDIIKSILFLQQVIEKIEAGI